jgi:RND family efflux transporter MFP subunit
MRAGCRISRRGHGSIPGGPGLGLGLALLLASVACNRGPATPDVAAPVVATVRIATVDRGPVVERIDTMGTAEFDPEHLVSTALVRAGQIVEVKVVSGQPVKAGDVLLTLGSVPAGSLEAQKARIDVDFADRELTRIRRLLAEKLATNQDLQNAEKQLESNRAALAALGAGDGSAPVVLRTPADGIVAQVLVKPGSLVQAGQEAVTLAVHRAMIVRAGFEVEDVARLTEGEPIELAPVYAAPEAQPVTATLSRIHAVADPATQLVEAIVRTSDPPAWLLAGMRIRVRAEVVGKRGALRLPRDAIVERDGKPGAFVVTRDEALWHGVALGIHGGEYVEIQSGLAAGDVVVTEGRSSLADGMRIRIDERGGTS